MTPERRINWQRMVEIVRDVEPTIWAKVREGGKEKTKGKVYCHGYYLSYGGFNNYPPRIIIKAELDLPEGEHTDHESLDRFIDNVAESYSCNEFTLETTVYPSFPLMDLLEKDPVFGTQPEIPNSIRYSLQVDRKDFILE